MEVENMPIINPRISDIVCNQKGILNLGYVTDIQKNVDKLHIKDFHVKQLVDMIISTQENSKYYDTLILNYDQFSESLTDPRYSIIKDKAYEYFFSSNFKMLGVNFQEGNDIYEILENRLTYNYEIISFRVNQTLTLIDENQPAEKQDNQIKQHEEDYQKQIVAIGQNIKKCQELYDDLIYLIDFNISHQQSSKTQNGRELLKLLEKKLYNFCTQTLLQNDIPLQNVIISLNLPLIGCNDIANASRYMEESAFNSLMMLSHALPSSIGGVVVTFEGILDMNTFAKYLNYIHRMKVINYFPITYMTHPVTFEYLAKNWKGLDQFYMATFDHFFRCSESFEAGLNGNYKIQLDQLVLGLIEFGDIISSS